ncbi:MAG: transcriptional regulator NrdR [Clostridia bacterium]
MKCMFCGCKESKVIDSRQNDEGTTIRRRRECISCGRRFTTYETVETFPIMVIKKSGARQPFSISKLRQGILRACDKRPITIEQIDNLVSDIQKKISNMLVQELTSTQIGEIVMQGLKEVDDIAYVRFAAVYKQFKNIDSWKEFIDASINDKNKK